MGSVGASLKVVVGSDIKDATAGLNKVNSLVRGAAGFLSTAAASAFGFGAAILGLQAAAGVASALNSAIFGMNSTLQGAHIAFTTLLGSGDAATKMLDDIKQFAKTTPFDLPQVLAGARNLLAYGFAADQVLPLLRDMGNVSSGLDLGAEGISRMTRALGQMKAKGRVLAEDLNQLQEVGVNTNEVFAIMAKRMGTTVPQLKKLQEAGKLPASEFLAAFQVFSQEKFGGLMEAQSKTLVGAMSNIRDALGQAGAQAFGPFFSLVQAGALRIAQFLETERFAGWVATVSSVVGTASAKIQEFIDKVSPDAATNIENFFSGIAEAAGKLPGVLTTIQENAPTIQAALAGIATAWGFVTAAALAASAAQVAAIATNPITLIAAALGLAVALIVKYWADISAAFETAKTAIWNTIRGLWENLTRFFQFVGLAMGALASGNLQNIARLGTALQNMMQGTAPIEAFPQLRGPRFGDDNPGPTNGPVSIGTINVRSQDDLDYIAALVGAQEEVSAAASPDAPGQ